VVTVPKVITDLDAGDLAVIEATARLLGQLKGTRQTLELRYLPGKPHPWQLSLVSRAHTVVGGPTGAP
jgi:hypothetical protein